MATSSRLSDTALSFTNAGGQGSVSYSNSGDLEINAPVLAQSITASALVVGSNASVVATSTFGEISVSSLKDVGVIEMDGSTSGTITVQPAATTTNYTLTLPATQGSADTFLKNNGSGGLTWAAGAGGGGSGDVVGPSSASDNAVARFDWVSGKLLQTSAVTISDTADVAGVKTLALSGATSGAMTVQPAATTTSYTVTLPGAQGAAATYLRNDGSGTLSWSSVAGGGGAGNLLNMQVFNSASGTYTYTPTAGCSRALVYVVGGGGAGGGCTSGLNKSVGAGGAGGGCRVGLFAVADGQTGTVVVGAGGAGVSAGTGSSGSNSTFTYSTSSITGTGGTGGTVTTNANLAYANPIALADSSASATNAVLISSYGIFGSLGPRGETYAAGNSVYAGAGGNSAFGGGAATGGAAGGSTGAAGQAGKDGVGGGGSGAYQTDGTARAGGSGGFGGVYVLEYANANGIGDLIGPASATDNAVARFDATTGKLLQNSGVTISDTAVIAGAKGVAMNGSSSGTLTIQPAASTTGHTLTLPSAQGSAGTVLRNNGNGGLSWSRTTQPIFYWSRPANGDPRSSQTYNGTFSGDATMTGVAVYDGVRLTTNSNNLLGAVNWNITGFDFSMDFVLRVNFYQGLNADGIFIGFGGSSEILSSATANNAVLFQYNTYSSNQNTQFYRNGSAQGSALNWRAGPTYTNTWMTTTIEHRTYGSTKILSVYHGSHNNMENAIVTTGFTFGGSYLCVGARTGLSNGQHFVNGVTLEYL
jgi:hypothetical protein